MEEFELIDRERLKNGYTTHSFKTYNKYCNKMSRKCSTSDSNLRLIYKLESNISKYRMLNSIVFLYKNRRLLKKLNTPFSNMYLKYLKCFIDNEKGLLETNDLIQLRQSLADYYSFLEDIHLINNNTYDFESYKVKHIWHDITLLFETDRIRETFINKTFILNDFRFNTRLALKILSVEEKKDRFSKLLETNRSPLDAFEAANTLYNSVDDLDRFLNDNFVESDYVTELKNSSTDILRFIKSVMEYSNGVNADKAGGMRELVRKIEEFKTPLHFEDVAIALEKMKNERAMDRSHARSVLLGLVEKRLRVDVDLRRMPFSPVFYDLAYDYIDYSSIDNSISGLLQNFNFSNKD